MTTTMEQRVAAGAALLDQKNPGWRERINVEELQLWSRFQCILGQLYGVYETGLGALGAYGNDGYNNELDWAIRHGFNGRFGDPLNEAWKRELAK